MNYPNEIFAYNEMLFYIRILYINIDIVFIFICKMKFIMILYEIKINNISKRDKYIDN